MSRGRVATALQILLFAASCREAAVPPPAREAPRPARPARDAAEQGNLLNIALGASVVSRTAELTLDDSALRAIDGNPDSPWNTPPGDGLQTLVFALPARTRIEKVGARIQLPKVLETRGARFETSVDAVHFTTVAAPAFAAVDEVQYFPIKPVEATYLRVTTTDVPGTFGSFRSIQVLGNYVEPPAAGVIEGCWTINGMPARFSSTGGRVTGVIGADPPTELDGAVDGPVYRFAWREAGAWGFALITVAPNGRTLSGMQWYQEPKPYDYGTSWFGQQSGCAAGPAAAASDAVMRRFLERRHRFPLFALHFDATGRLSEGESVTALESLLHLSAQHSSQRLRLLSAEYRQASPEENRRRAQARLDSLRAVLQKRGADLTRFEFVATGSDQSPQPIENESMRVLYSVVDIEAPIVEGR